MRILLFCLIALFASCSETEPTPLTTTGSILGTWTVSVKEYSKCSDTGNNQLEKSTCPVYCTRYTFSDDGKLIFQDIENGDVVDSGFGSYSISSGKLIISNSVYGLSITGSSMVWVYTDNGCTVTITFTK